LNDKQIQNPSKPFGIVPLSNFAPRGFGFVHHSIALLYHEVPNPNLTIRDFLIAVNQAKAGLLPTRRGIGGIVVGDVVLAVDGIAVKDAVALDDAVQVSREGATDTHRSGCNPNTTPCEHCSVGWVGATMPSK
jgi:hypothetical protein